MEPEEEAQLYEEMGRLREKNRQKLLQSLPKPKPPKPILPKGETLGFRRFLVFTAVAAAVAVVAVFILGAILHVR